MVETITDAPRARLLAAGEARFRRFGYRRTTVEDITNEAGTGKGSLYLHFDSKQAIYLAVVETSLERFIQRASSILRTDDPVPVRLRRLVAATAEHYGQDELLHASLFGEGEFVDGEVSRLAAEIQRTRMRALLADALRTGQAAGSVRASLDADTTASVLHEIGWAIVRAELEGIADIPLDVALNSLNDMVGRGIMAR